MKPLTCAAARRRLNAYYDRELPFADEIAVASHLDWCDECTALVAELERVRALLRAAAPGRDVLTREDAAVFNMAVVNRLKAEQEASLLAHVQGMFEDMHLVYVGLAATAAALVCVAIMLGMMRFATSGRPDSLAAIVNFLATPGSNENPVTIDERVLLPRALDASFSTSDRSAEQDAVFTLAAVVTREGRIANLELLLSNGGRDAEGATADAKLVEGLLDAVSRARFEPARMAGLPVAVNMVWLVAHTTVRANKNQTLDFPAPATAKKRVAFRAPDLSCLVNV